MKARTLVSFIDNNLSTSIYPSTLTAINYRMGFTDLSLKDAKKFFYGEQGLTMYQVIITHIEIEYQSFYSEFKNNI